MFGNGSENFEWTIDIDQKIFVLDYSTITRRCEVLGYSVKNLNLDYNLNGYVSEFVRVSN